MPDRASRLAAKVSSPHPQHDALLGCPTRRSGRRLGRADAKTARPSLQQEINRRADINAWKTLRAMNPSCYDLLKAYTPK